MEIIDFPKIESPFERQEINGKYVCIPKIVDKYRWIFTEDCIPSEKLHGTNVSIAIQDGVIIGCWNREERLPFFNKGKRFIIEGLLESYNRGYTEFLPDGQHFGELIGEKMQGNPYLIEGHIWMPFQQLRKRYAYKFWNKLSEEIKDKSDEEIFKEVSEVFKELISLYKLTLKPFNSFNSKPLKELIANKVVNENTGFGNTDLSAEGIVFYNKKTGEMCKIRRDMFSFFQGRNHKE